MEILLIFSYNVLHNNEKSCSVFDFSKKLASRFRCFASMRNATVLEQSLIEIDGVNAVFRNYLSILVSGETRRRAFCILTSSIVFSNYSKGLFQQVLTSVVFAHPRRQCTPSA